MAKISRELKSILDDTSTRLDLTFKVFWKEMDIDEFHELRIVQEEFEKVRKKLEARK